MQDQAARHPAATAFKVEDAASYDSVVDDFDLLTNRYTAPIAGQVIAMANIHPGDRVLDVGCGTGVLTFLAARNAGTQGHVVGIDLSDGMLAKAKTLALAEPHRDRIEFVKGDAEHMQFPDGGFQSVVSLYALRHFPDPEQALREMFRCSAPGSQTLVAVGSAPPTFSGAFFKAGVRVLSDRVLALAGRAPFHAPAFLDRLIREKLSTPGDSEHASWTHGVKQYAGTVATLMQRVGYDNIQSAWMGHAAMLASVDDFWTLQVTLSSFARKRMQMASPAEYKTLRGAFDELCGRQLSRGGGLVYKSGALVTTGSHPLR